MSEESINDDPSGGNTLTEDFREDEIISSFLARSDFSDDERELLKSCLRTEKSENLLTISIEIVDYWESAHQPVSKWIAASKLEADSQQTFIDDRIRRILNSKKYFDFCADCRTRLQKGWLIDKYCSSCALQKHGIIS